MMSLLLLGTKGWEETSSCKSSLQDVGKYGIEYRYLIKNSLSHLLTGLTMKANSHRHPAMVYKERDTLTMPSTFPLAKGAEAVNVNNGGGGDWWNAPLCPSAERGREGEKERDEANQCAQRMFAHASSCSGEMSIVCMYMNGGGCVLCVCMCVCVCVCACVRCVSNE